MSTIARLFAVLLAVLALTSALQAQPQEALTFGRVFMGDLGGGTQASTEVLLTNRDPNQTGCRALVFFFQNGSTAEPEVLINGEVRPSNALEVDIPQGGARKIIFTADQGLVTGAALIAPFAPCDENSISGQGRFLIQSPTGTLNEIYSIAPNSQDKWLRNNRCVAISTCYRRAPGTQGPGNNLGIATTSVLPGVTAPTGTELMASIFDDNGQQIGQSQSFPIDGSHQAFFPIDSFQGVPDGALTLILCFFSPDTGLRVDLTTIQAGTDSDGNVQFDAPIFADGFESGDTSAWPIQ